MNADTIHRLSVKLSESPIIRADSLPSEAEVDDASNEIGVPFSADFRGFLLEYGAAMVGPHPIFGLRPVEVMGDDSWSVVAMTKRFRDEGIPAASQWIIISSDHAGNPVGMDRDGLIWIYDHDCGGVSPLSKSFEEYLRVRCLGLDA